MSGIERTDRHKISYLEVHQGGELAGQRKTFDVRVGRIVKVIDRGLLSTVVCFSTQDFRYLCRTQVTESDTVLELG